MSVESDATDTPAENPFGCPCCFGADPEAAWSHKLRMRCTLIDESHFGVMLRVCPDCAQNYLSIFTEFVDWVDGDDPQYWDVIPLTVEEADKLAAQADGVSLKLIAALARDRRRLQVDHPKGKPRRATWTTGDLLIVPGH